MERLVGEVNRKVTELHPSLSPSCHLTQRDSRPRWCLWVSEEVLSEESICPLPHSCLACLFGS